MTSTLPKNQALFRTLYIAGLLLVVAILLFAAANQKSFWEDESFTAIFAQRDLSELLQGIAWDVHPPLYLLAAGQWGRLFGFDELGLRSFSILCTLAALLLTYKLARDLFDERVGLVAITLLAFTPLLVLYGHSARYYALSLVLALLAAWSMFRFERPRQALFLGIYILSGTAFLYLLFAAAVVLAACNLCCSVSRARRLRRSARPAACSSGWLPRRRSLACTCQVCAPCRRSPERFPIWQR